MQSKSASVHYDKKYFEWQRKVGEFTSRANQIKFKKFCDPKFRTVDFGCGGGFMLAGLPAKERIGVEINPAARKLAEKNGLKTFEKASLLPDGWADLIISDNALEHTPNPLEELKMLFKKLKKGGTAVFVLPCEHLDFAYHPKDVNQHLYSWGPMSAGNLFALAGFEVISSKAFYHKHIPYSHRIRPLIGQQLFNIACKVNGLVNRRMWNEVRVHARKPE
jgi:SAM-dependent methyltransferase